MAAQHTKHPSAAHIAKYVAQHRDYCAQFRYSFSELKFVNLTTGDTFTDAEYNKLVHSHLMTMTSRILKVKP